jgi:hypothetical protein
MTWRAIIGRPLVKASASSPTATSSPYFTTPPTATTHPRRTSLSDAAQDPTSPPSPAVDLTGEGLVEREAGGH